MKPPPLLLGVALIFWGWQADFLIVGLALAAMLEGTRLVTPRWELSDEDFKRIWMFSLLAMLAGLIFAFNLNQGPSGVANLAYDPNVPEAQRNLSNASGRTAIAGVRWAPMIFFLFAAAFCLSSRREIPLQTLSPFFWRNRERSRKAGVTLPPGRTFNPAYLYFSMCLVAASTHPETSAGFFGGFTALTAWALWPFRPRRYGLAVWGLMLGLALGLGFGGHVGLTKLQQLITGYSPGWMADLMSRGRVDPTRNKTALGEIGRLAQSGQILIRLKTPVGVGPPTLLREAAYVKYSSPWWTTVATNRTFEDVGVEASLTTWRLAAGPARARDVQIASYLPGRRGLLPLPTDAYRLDDLNVDFLKTNGLGAVWGQGPGLVIFNAWYGSDQVNDAPPDWSTNQDLQVPHEELAALDQVIAELQADGLDPEAKIRRVEQYFVTHDYKYTIWQRPPPAQPGDTETPLARFLLHTHEGHCEYYATATTLLLRRLGIPARYTIGYLVHEQSGPGRYVVRSRDGHAWVRVWDTPRQTWVDVDTTPASRNLIEAQRASVFQFLSDGWSWLWFQFSKFRWGQTNWRQYLLWALVPVLALLLFQIFYRALRRRARPQTAISTVIFRPGLDSDFYQVERRLGPVIGVRRPEEPLALWLERAAVAPPLAGLQDLLRQMLTWHYRYRFDPAGLEPENREALRRAVHDCLQRLEATNSPNS